MKAVWKNAVIAESDDTVVVEGNHYFPYSALKHEHRRPSEHHSICSWKGETSYYDDDVDGSVNANAARFYPQPKDAAESVRGRVAFWHGVVVSP